MYARVINGQVTQVGLPTTGMLNGNTVSNYHLLPQQVLIADGWLPLVDSIPTYDDATQYIELSEYTIGESSVTAVYVVVDNPVQEPTLEDRVDAVEDILMEILI